MDVHTRYAADYVYKCVVALANSKATCVGGAWIAQGFTPLQRIIAAAFQSKVGSGGAASRQINFSGWVDTVYLGAWRRHELMQLGGFDEALVRNQDDELCLRIHRRGGRVWQSNEIHSTYIPRESFKSLYMQFSQYGYWKIPVIRKHKIPASIRHLAPFVFLLLLTVLMLVSFFIWTAGVVLFAVTLIYIFGLYLGTKDQFVTLAPSDPRWLTLVAVAIMHLGYAVGFGRAILDFIILRRNGRKSMTKLTR
jgi:cellulose synthase/poly-beta-1,6-N-acetylglucosamine synthase-like glycosyltransferase